MTVGPHCPGAGGFCPGGGRLRGGCPEPESWGACHMPSRMPRPLPFSAPPPPRLAGRTSCPRRRGRAGALGHSAWCRPSCRGEGQAPGERQSPCQGGRASWRRGQACPPTPAGPSCLPEWEGGRPRPPSHSWDSGRLFLSPRPSHSEAALESPPPTPASHRPPSAVPRPRLTRLDQHFAPRSARALERGVGAAGGASRAEPQFPLP